MENIAKYFASQGREVPKHCDNQASIIEGALVLENLKGSSPGQFIEIEKNKIVILLPGPKEEVKYILYRNLLKILNNAFKKSMFFILGILSAMVIKLDTVFSDAVVVQLPDGVPGNVDILF